MRNDGGAEPLVFFAFIAAPALPVGHEETLRRRETFDWAQLLAGCVLLPRKISEERAAQVGEVLAVCEFAVDLYVVDDGVARVLVDDTSGALFELFAIGIGPPVAEVAVGVELAAFVVEGVRE